MSAEADRGRPGWLELNAQRAPEATAFYAALFGWSARPLHVAPFGSMPILASGAAEFANEFLAMGAFATPRWLTWWAADLDRAAERLLARGIDARRSTIEGNGARLDAVDPWGAAFGLIEREGEIWADGAPGLPVAAELWAPDGAERAEFYAHLLDLEAAEGPGGQVLSADGRPRLGLRSVPYEIAPPRWIPAFASASPAADVERARRLGAIVQVPLAVAGPFGETAVLADPAGVCFALMSCPRP